MSSNEIWKDINGYETLYQISNLGNVRKYNYYRSFYNKKLNKPFSEHKPHFTQKGYLLIGLTKGGVKKNISIHRIVADNFIPNPENKPQVNHINGIKTDNSVLNLEWCTNQENQNHAVKMGLKARIYGADVYNAKIVIDMNTGVMFYTMREASKAYNIGYKYLSLMLVGKCRNKTSLSYL